MAWPRPRGRCDSCRCPHAPTTLRQFVACRCVGRLMDVNSAAAPRGTMRDVNTVAEKDDLRFAENGWIAERLRQAAEILQAQGANPFRVSAYRKAADTVAQFPGSLRETFAQQGRAGLDALPGIGIGIASAIAEMLATGRWTQLERLRGSLDPTLLFRTVPGIGPELAQRIHDALGVE